MSRAFGKKKPVMQTPERKPSGIKQELRSPGAPGQELEGEYEGSIPERSFISIANHVRAHVKGFAERLRALWRGVTDRVRQPFIPRKAPMIFRWHSNSAWNPREWITKRLNMRQKGGYWDNEELYDKVRSIADPHIEKKRRGATKAKDLQDEITYLLNEAVRSDKESHILGWMVLLYMHSELEKNSKWSLSQLYTPAKMSSVFNFIYHLSNDLGSVFVMKAFAQRGHSPRLYKCEEGTLHYPAHTHTLWADVGNAMYAYMNDHLNLVSDGPGLGPEQAGDVIEIAYNLYAMYALLNIDVESLLGIDQSVLTGWWAQINMIQRDAYIQSASMISGSKCSSCRFEQVCIYISGLTQLTATEAISVVKGKESHTGTVPVPYCYICGAVVGQKRETTSLYAASQSYWSHTDHCMKSRLCGYVNDKALLSITDSRRL